MGRTKLSDAKMIDRAKMIISALGEGGWHRADALSRETGLTVAQVHGAIKYERRYFLKCPEKCGSKYIISGAKGYKLPETNEDYVAMYKSLYSWGKSVLITISPMGKWLQSQGYDMKQIREEAMSEESFSDPAEVGGADSWHE